MQIHNNTGSYTNAEYQHTHYITECLHEQEQQKQQNAAGGLKTNALSQTNIGEQSEQFQTMGIGLGETRRISGLRKGLVFIKGVWDSMGQEPQNGTKILEASTAGKINPAGTEAAGATQRMGFPQGILLRITGFREKIKVGVYTALKRFNKGKDTFTAMPDADSRSASHKHSGTLNEKKKEQSIGREDIQLEMAQPSNSHLMDSYSKKGEYCQINENLTYSQKQQNQDAKKVTEDNEHGI